MAKSSLTPITNLPISRMDMTIVVEPNAAYNGYADGSYDSAEVVASFHVQNAEDRKVAILLPFETENFSATAAVTSAGPDEYKNRVKFRRINGKDELDEYLANLSKALTPEEQANLKNIAKGFRIVELHLPPENCVVRIAASQQINPIVGSSNKEFAFRAFSPLPSFMTGSGAVSLELVTLFKGEGYVNRTIDDPDISDPFGHGAGEPQNPIIGQICGKSKLYCWSWQKDPVVEFKYRYN